MMDYRQSHIDKGATYDEGLASDPWDSYMNRWEERYLRRTVSRLFPGGIPRYLDYACGTGRVTAIMTTMAELSIGVDIAADMLQVARAKVPDARFIQADLTKNSVGLSNFDVVTAFRFFGNAQPELREESLRALNALQPTGGYLIANNHRNPNSLTELIHRMRGGATLMDLTHGRFRTLLSAAGYRVVKTYPIGVWKFRGKLFAKATERAEARLERLFKAGAFAAVAPDTVIVAKKVRAS